MVMFFFLISERKECHEESTAFLLTDAMKDVITKGTGK